MKNKILFSIFLSIACILLQACANSDGGAADACRADMDMNSVSVDKSQVQKGTLVAGGLEREYLLFLPANYTAEVNYPLVLYLHSYGSTPWLEMEYTRFNQVANSCGFLIAYPAGEPNWNSGISDYPFYPTPNIDDVAFISTLLDALVDEYGIDISRIYAAGFSNGGFMAYKLACQLNDRIAAVASVSGVMSNSVASSCRPLHPTPVLHIHGTEDPAIPAEGIGPDLLPSVDETLDYWVGFNQCRKKKVADLPDEDPDDGSTVERITHTDCAKSSDVIYYKVIHGGHSWPGAPVSVYPGLNRDFNASSAIWDFFSNHQLPSAGSD